MGDELASDFRGHDLANDIAVGKANDETVFWGIVFVLGLGDEPFTSVVVGLASTAALVLGLVAAAEGY